MAGWAPPTLPGTRAGSLYARSGGDGDHAVILLHGLVSSGDVFGAAYDRLAQTHRVVVPDLLGFSRSIDDQRESFSADDHLDALDDLAERTGLFARRVTIGAHSMGSALALRWASRHPAHVERVVCWGAPIYPSPEQARERISGSTMARLFVLDTTWAEHACALSCRHRTLAGWLAVASEPELPIAVARAAALHTWPAYRDAMRQFVIDPDWPQLLAAVDRNRTSVQLAWGTKDPVGDHRYAGRIAADATNTTLVMVPHADHRLPMTQAERCISHLAMRDLRPYPLSLYGR